MWKVSAFRVDAVLRAQNTDDLVEAAFDA